MPNNDYLSYMRLVLGLYILKILQQEPAHGNKISEEIKRRTNQYYTPNTNALYPLLRLMEEKKYVVGEWNNPASRGKRIYTITELGLAKIPELELAMNNRLTRAEEKISILRSDLLGR